ncbi:MAG: 3,4-dihydroxy-2-butanone-4-phosphate synthase [Nitrososphaerales archaeon]
MSLTDALNDLRKGRFILLHDGESRENEIDMVIAAQFVTPEHVARMRSDAGGLLCLALRHDIAGKLGLLYMHDMLHLVSQASPTLPDLADGSSPYGDRPAFSIAVNHRQTYTGITDADRALTISEMARISSKTLNGSSPDDAKHEFVSAFRAPGHVPILIASRGLLDERLGHTELAVYLTQLAGLMPVAVVCEMLDGSTYKALSLEGGRQYAGENNFLMLEGSDLKMHFAKVH